MLFQNSYYVKFQDLSLFVRKYESHQAYHGHKDDGVELFNSDSYVALCLVNCSVLRCTRDSRTTKQILHGQILIHFLTVSHRVTHKKYES